MRRSYSRFMRTMRYFLLSVVLVIIAVICAGGLVHSQAQGNFTIHISEPADGTSVSGTFTLRGEATVPAEKTLTLQVLSADGKTTLASSQLKVQGEVGKSGTFSQPLGFNVNSDTAILIRVLYASNGSTVAQDEVHVTLQKPVTPQVIIITATPSQPTAEAPAATLAPAGVADLAALQLALSDYAARIELVQPIPVSVEDRSFANQCLELARTNEVCTAGQVDGKVVTLSYGGVTYIYHVGNNQARLNLAKSGPIDQKGNGKIPQIFSDATTATGVTLFIPKRFNGSFQGLVRSNVSWDTGVVTIVYALPDNPINITITEKARTPDSALPGPGTGETITVGALTAPIQLINGRREVTWTIQGTIVTVSVPASVSTSDLSDLANSFSALGAAEPGQLTPYDRAQFDKLTLALAEPIRSVEMARQAFMSFLGLPRKGALVAIQQRQFTDSCLQLKRIDDAACTPAIVPGYVIGIADAELFRYHVAGNQIRLNRDNSVLVDPSGTDYATLEGVQSAVQFALVTPNDSAVTFLEGEVGRTSGSSSVLLIYHDNKTNGVVALRESVVIGTVPAAQEPIQAAGKATTQVIPFTLSNGKTTLITLWSSAEIGAEDLSRIRASLAEKSSNK